jgi:hypothetical protein
MWNVGIVQPISDPGMDGPAWGFNITNESGRPIISFICRGCRDACTSSYLQGYYGPLTGITPKHPPGPPMTLSNMRSGTRTIEG